MKLSNLPELSNFFRYNTSNHYNFKLTENADGSFESVSSENVIHTGYKKNVNNKSTVVSSPASRLKRKIVDCFKKVDSVFNNNALDVQLTASTKHEVRKYSTIKKYKNAFIENLKKQLLQQYPNYEFKYFLVLAYSWSGWHIHLYLASDGLDIELLDKLAKKIYREIVKRPISTDTKIKTVDNNKKYMVKNIIDTFVYSTKSETLKKLIKLDKKFAKAIHLKVKNKKIYYEYRRNQFNIIENSKSMEIKSILYSSNKLNKSVVFKGLPALERYRDLSQNAVVLSEFRYKNRYLGAVKQVILMKADSMKNKLKIPKVNKKELEIIDSYLWKLITTKSELFYNFAYDEKLYLTFKKVEKKILRQQNPIEEIATDYKRYWNKIDINNQKIINVLSDILKLEVITPELKILISKLSQKIDRACSFGSL